MNDHFYEKVKELAYFKWVEAGKPEDRDLEFWFLAKDIISQQEKELFINIKISDKEDLLDQISRSFYDDKSGKI
jgi:hypothetical protein